MKEFDQEDQKNDLSAEAQRNDAAKAIPLSDDLLEGVAGGGDIGSTASHDASER